MNTPIQLIVGLANPGPEYAQTRHNAGAWFVDAIAASTNTLMTMEKRFHGFYGWCEIAGQRVHLLIPTTFMNLSGRAIRALAQFYKIPPEAILVAHDELDLAPGTIRLKQSGGTGGHNGLKDTIAQLGTEHFARMRIGIGHPGRAHEVVAYVLHKPKSDEQKWIEDSLIEALAVLPQIIRGEGSKAMQQLHTSKP